MSLFAASSCARAFAVIVSLAAPSRHGGMLGDVTGV